MSNLAERISALSPQQRALLDKQLQAKRQKSHAALQTITPQERAVLLAIHRGGLSFPDAMRVAGVSGSRPDSYVATPEVRWVAEPSENLP